MRKLIFGGVMLLLFSGLALAQGRRVVQISIVEGTARGTQANSVSVMWDDGAGKRQRAFIARNGRDQFIILPPRPINAPIAESVPVPRDTISGYEMILRPVIRTRTPSVPMPTETESGDTILGYETILQQVGSTTVHYSEKLGMALKIVSPDGTSEVLLVDDQADFDPRNVDVTIFEQLAVKAEGDGQKLYAEQIRELVEQWKRALSNLPESSR